MSYDPNDAKSIFLQAAELPTSGERAAFLEQACAGKPELKARVESLLKTALDPDSLLDQPVAEFGATRMAPPDTSPVSLDFLEASDAAGSLGRLAGYEILEVIGRGGMGIVLRAMDVKLNRVVAIKVLAPELASNPQARKRFLREAQAAAAVSHDHVVTIHAVDDGASGGNKVPLLVMECIVGQSLQEKIDKVGALGLKEILRIGMQIASGLAAAHKQGLVHRDIKPANILLENGVERVKITDFGLARATDDVGITQSGQIAGTPQYMSPEQAMGQPVDQRSDLFSLGSVLYTMCTGRPAFRADSAVAVLRRVCDDTPRPINEVNAEVPDWLIAIVNRLMAKKAEGRFQTAQEVAGLLEKWLAHCQQPATVPRPPMPESVTPVETLNTAAAEPETESSLGAFVTGVLTLFFIAVVGIFAAELTGYLGAERRSFTMTYLIAALMGFLLIAKLASAAFNWLREPATTRSSQEPSIDSRFNHPASTTPPRGTLSRAWDAWWSERDRWITISVQTVLILVYLVCMICFVSMGGSGGQDAEGHVTFGYRLGVPDPWFQFEVYPQPNMPFRTLFNLWSSSVLIGLVGCAAYYVFWQIEKARDPKTSKWNGPALMLGIWGVGALFAVGLGHWQGYAALNKPRVAATQRAPLVDANAAAIDLNGAWDGSRPWRAEFTHVQIKPGLKSVPINGKLTVADGPEGTFRIDAMFDVASRTIEGQFHGDWGGGRMRLVVSDDGNSMEGTYGWLKTVSGEEPVTAHRWDMRRRGKAVNSAQTVVQHPADRLDLPAPDGKPFDLWKHAALVSDRTAAEWVLSIHGKVRINDSDVELKAVSDLPSEPFRLTAVDLEDNPSVTTAGLACFADCRHLRSLRLSGPGLTTEGLAHFKNIGDLTQLNLGGPGLTDVGISHFRTCLRLSHVTLTGLGVTDSGLGHVRELPQLELLSLTGTHLTDAGLTALHSAKQLRDLNVAGTDVTIGGINSLKRALPQCRIVWNGSIIEPTLQPAVAPFDAVQAKAHQAAWAKHLGVDVEHTNSIRMKLQLIPPGEFTMGTAPGAADRLVANPGWYFARWVGERRQAEGPPRVVRISQPMYVGAHEVTVGQFAEFLKDRGYKTEAETDSSGGYSWRDGTWKRDETARWHNPGFLQSPDHPVSNVAWSDAVAFCDWLSRQEGVEYRLPREVEWEYACRAGSTTLFSTGDDPASLEGFANIADAAVLEHHKHMTWAAPWNDGFTFTAPVGSFKPNNFGLFDMHGNVHEWCFDGYDANAYSRLPATDPVGPTDGSRHVYRGGGWDNWLGFCRSADRYGSHSETLRTQWAGFRVVRTFGKSKRQSAMTRRNPPASPEASPTATTEHIELVQTLPVGSLVGRLLRPMDGQRLIAVGSENANDAVVKVWDSETLAEISTWRREEWLKAFEVLPRANRILTVEADKPNGFLVRDDKTFEVLTLFSNHSLAVTSLSASQDGRWLASGDQGGTLNLWQYDRQKNEATPKALSGHSLEVTTLAFSPDGSLLASGSLDKTVRVFDVATGHLKYTLDRATDRITQVAFSPDGQSLAAASWDKMAWVYDLKAGNETGALRGHTDKLTSIAFSPDGKLVATGCFDGMFLVFNRSSGHIVARANAHQNQVFGVAFLGAQPQGQRLATGHRNGMVNVWRLRP